MSSGGWGVMERKVGCVVSSLRVGGCDVGGGV